MAPVKIYVGVRDLGSGYATDVSLSPRDGYPEYIRKDALLEWVREYLDLKIYDTKRAVMEELIDKLNSM